MDNNNDTTTAAEIKDVQPVIRDAYPLVQRSSVEVVNGVITPKNIDEAYRYAVAISKSGLAPKQFDTPEKIMVGMQFAQELGLPALTALKSMYIINGIPALFGDLPLALVQKSGHLEYIIEKQFNEKNVEICKANDNLQDDVSFAVCTLKRKGQPETERVFSWFEAKKAGLDKNKFGEKETYKGYRKRMLQMRSRSWALKDVFPDVLLGIAIQEYDYFDTPKDVTPTEKKSALNDLLKKPTEVVNDSTKQASQV